MLVGGRKFHCFAQFLCQHWGKQEGFLAVFGTKLQKFARLIIAILLSYLSSTWLGGGYYWEETQPQ